jgi:hypothetical protein
VHSGPRVDDPKACVTVCNDVSPEDIGLIFSNAKVRDPDLEAHLKEGCSGPLEISCSEISPCMSPYLISLT